MHVRPWICSLMFITHMLRVPDVVGLRYNAHMEQTLFA